uniref:Pentraxin family member n=1 Tax=Periophthalmus magnuspinnatus TaxID=409849 RepID=A0A3B4B447_9GOBI
MYQSLININSVCISVKMRLSAVLLFCAASLTLAGGVSVRSLLFSSESASNFVTVQPQKPLDLSAFTLCLRLATELKMEQREIILFAYRTKYYDELNLWRELDGRIGLYLSGDGVFFQMPPLGSLQTHLCITWDSLTGATSVFMDGKKSLTKIYQKRHNVRSGGQIIIGQDPDEYLGGFDANQSFVGEISDINLWSNVLPDTVIKAMADNGNTVQTGDVIDWSVANLEVTGQVNVGPDT